MNFMRNTGGNGEEEEEREKQTPPTKDWLLSSSSGSYHHQHHSRHQPQQQQPFFPPPPYHHHRDGWRQPDGGEPSTNYDEEHGVMTVEREHMFDKVVTPSDVGKLNRLVIPKQHAERYFPLDSSSTDKGLLLNFEDRNGKMWRFRYSYWNSSQSYVMTKGWSRFVKDKNLDAGDVVSFQRGVGVSAKDRLFIDWRRRVNAFSQPIQLSSSSNLSFSLPQHNLYHPWSPLVLKSNPARRNPNLMPPPPTSNPSENGGSRSLFYFRPPRQNFQMIEMQQRNGFGFGLGINPIPPPLPTPHLNGKASGKRLRLFGVNMDCPFSEDDRDKNYTDGVSHQLPIIPRSSSPPSSTIPYLQLSLFGEGNECNQSRIFQSSSGHDINKIDKSTGSSMSLDLDI